MTRFVLLVTSVLAASVTACTARPIDLGPAASAGPVVCDTNCKVAWERAQLWINKHSTRKIQTATDVIVQTYNPESGTGRFGFTAVKEPTGDGKYRITLEAVCGESLIGCDPRPEDVVAAFNHYVATGRDVLTESGKRYTAIH